jgi:1-acyl-sn-glycerol-3-phosphate acyltransferase
LTGALPNPDNLGGENVSARYWNLHDSVEQMLLARFVDPEVKARLARVPARLNEFGYDPWGFSPEGAAPWYSFGAWLYRKYFRVEVEGLEKIPDGPVLLIANHGGQIAWDGFLLTCALLLDKEPPRLARGMGERFITNTPFLSQIVARMGHVLGEPENCRRLLEAGEAIMVFPEGVRGISKTIFERYELRDFGSGFVRLAVATETPVVPIGIVGAEEAMPGIWDAKPLVKRFGLPSFPVTPFFPLLGPLGALPLPTKVRIYVDEPMRLAGDPDEPEEVARKKAELVRARVQALVRLGLEQRQGIFS